jgi:CRISPR-associated endonuclease/helicase Cas3
MSDYKITLLPAYYSPTFAKVEGLKLPENWHLFSHQLEILEAVRNPNIDVIYYYGISNSGKSLASYLDTLQGGIRALGVYPTEELAEQEKSQIQKYLEKFQPDAKVRVNSFTKKDLEFYEENQDISLLESRIDRSEILLIDPDVLALWYQSQSSLSDNPVDRLWHQLEEGFNLLVIHEFYQFNPCQITSIINLMFLLYYRRCPQKFFYILTTPNPKMIARSQVLGWRVAVINAIEEKKDRFPQTKIESQQLETQKWRQVSPEINLNFISLQPQSSASEIWLREHKDSIVSQLVRDPSSKGAIVLNSLAAAKRLVPFFRNLLAPLGLEVVENIEPSVKLSGNLSIGTQTNGLGEEYPIDFLFFESANVGQFIHRLGKVRQKEAAPSLNAYALVPDFFVEHLFQGDSGLQGNTSCDPASFPTLIRSVYRRVGDWHGYYTRWGAIQSIEVYQQLGSPSIKQKYPRLQQEFKSACEEMFKFSLEEALGYYREWQQIVEKEGEGSDRYLKSLVRCSSMLNPLSCGLYNSKEKNEAERFKVCDLPEILIDLESEPISEGEFMELLKETATSRENVLPTGKFRRCLTWMKLVDYREERWNWRFISPANLERIAGSKKVQILSDLQIWQPKNDWIGELNLKLKKLTLVGYILDCPITEVRQKFRLPMHFPIYPISQQTTVRDAIAPYSVAFGESALLLDTWAS